VKNRESATTLASVATPATRQGDLSATGTTIFDHRVNAANERPPAVPGQSRPLLPVRRCLADAGRADSRAEPAGRQQHINTKINFFPSTRWNLFGRYCTFSAWGLPACSLVSGAT
jgi:hypothetical protein